jgi:predicted MFS family arabinose efflux permease
VSLGLGIFSIVMSEFLPASLLPRIADSLDVSSGAAGQSVTMTAVAAALSALFISAALPRTDRRHVMIGLTGLAIVSDVIVALAPDLTVLLFARILLGLALGGFWAMATAMASRLVHTDHVGRALTVINSGVALATIAAIPLGALLGDVWGWRGVFLLGAATAACALVMQVVTLPSVVPHSGNGLSALGRTLRSRVVIGGLSAILLIFGGHFGGYTYIREAVESVSTIDVDGFALLLLVFGTANVIGTAVSGPLADRAPRAGILLFPAMLGIGMLLLALAGGSTMGLFIAAGLWGFGFGGVPTTVLSWGARTQPTRLEQIGGLIVTVCNVAIAVGAVTGGALVDNVTSVAPLLVGGVAAIGGGILLVGLRARR